LRGLYLIVRWHLRIYTGMSPGAQERITSDG